MRSRVLEARQGWGRAAWPPELCLEAHSRRDCSCFFSVFVVLKTSGNVDLQAELT